MGDFVVILVAFFMGVMFSLNIMSNKDKEDNDE